MENREKEPPVDIIRFQEEIAKIQTAIADFESGHNLNVAIISEPYAGRTTFMNIIEKMNSQKVTKFSFSSIVKNKAKIILPGQSKRIVLIDDCQFLYMRKIGGFDVLEEFFSLISNPAILFISAWNLYSWKYLDEVFKIGKYFPVQIYLPKFTVNQLRESILSDYEKEEIKFIDDAEFEEGKIINFYKHQISIKFLNRIINLPSFKIDYNILKLRLLKKKERADIVDIIFEKIHHVSNGNPGIAKIIWQKSLEYPIIKPGKIRDESFNIELDYNDSFVLNIILSMESIKKYDLSEIVGGDFQIEKIIFQLNRQGLIKVEDGSCTIRPEAVKTVVEFLKKSRLVW